MISETDTRQVPKRRLSPKGKWTRGSVPAKTLGHEGGWIGGVPHRLEKGTSASEDTGVDCEIPYRLGRRMKRVFLCLSHLPNV